MLVASGRHVGSPVVVGHLSDSELGTCMPAQCEPMAFSSRRQRARNRCRLEARVENDFGDVAFERHDTVYLRFEIVVELASRPWRGSVVAQATKQGGSV